MPAPAIEVQNLSKSFGGIRVLNDVSLAVARGETHALVGRNGSGKSTLIKILSGYHSPDPGGSLHVAGRHVPLPLAPGQSHRLGMAFVHQDLGLIPKLTVLENMRVGRYRTGLAWRIRWRRERAGVSAALRRFGLNVSPDARVSALPAVERALVAIVRAFTDVEGHSGGILVLDEPTAYLPRDGVDRLFAAVRQVADSGTAVIFVSHQLDEVGALAESVSVLRDGELVGTVKTAQTTEPQLIEMILGRRLEAAYPEFQTRQSDVMLEVVHLSGRVARDVSFEVHRGEVLGLTGLIGMGHEEVPYLVFGASRALSGALRLAGRDISARTMSPRRAMQSGMALLPADRQGASGVGGLTVKENVTLPTLNQFYTNGLLRQRREASHAAGILRQFDVRPSIPGRRLETLSGGNQQKALLGKWLQRRPPIVMLHEPTQGVDVGARREIFDQIRRTVSEGSCAVMCSTEYEDLAHVCDRVLVFRYGRIVAEIAGDQLTEDRIVEQCYASDIGRRQDAG